MSIRISGWPMQCVSASLAKDTKHDPGALYADIGTLLRDMSYALFSGLVGELIVNVPNEHRSAWPIWCVRAIRRLDNRHGGDSMKHTLADLKALLNAANLSNHAS
jgi:hypothetical protein